jgi:hypothetical protein
MARFQALKEAKLEKGDYFSMEVPSEFPQPYFKVFGNYGDYLVLSHAFLHGQKAQGRGKFYHLNYDLHVSVIPQSSRKAKGIEGKLGKSIKTSMDFLEYGEKSSE